MTTSTTPLADVLKVSLRVEHIHSCNALGLLLDEIDPAVLQAAIHAAFGGTEQAGHPGEAAGENFRKALRNPWPGVKETLTRAAWHCVEVEPAPVIAIFADIVYDVFQDPETLGDYL
jgi:hypothetical protein